MFAIAHIMYPIMYIMSALYPVLMVSVAAPLTSHSRALTYHTFTIFLMPSDSVLGSKHSAFTAAVQGSKAVVCQSAHSRSQVRQG